MTASRWRSKWRTVCTPPAEKKAKRFVQVEKDMVHMLSDILVLKRRSLDVVLFELKQFVFEDVLLKTCFLTCFLISFYKSVMITNRVVGVIWNCFGVIISNKLKRHLSFVSRVCYFEFKAHTEKRRLVDGLLNRRVIRHIESSWRVDAMFKLKYFFLKPGYDSFLRPKKEATWTAFS